MRALFREEVLSLTGHEVTEANQVDDYGAGSGWKRRRQMDMAKRRKERGETSMAEVREVGR